MQASTDQQFRIALRLALERAISTVPPNPDGRYEAVAWELAITEGAKDSSPSARVRHARDVYRDSADKYVHNRWETRRGEPVYKRSPRGEALVEIAAALDDVINEPRHLPPSVYQAHDLLEQSVEGAQRLAAEFADVGAVGSAWWDRNEGRWFGSYFSFWRKIAMVETEHIPIHRVPELMAAEHYGQKRAVDQGLYERALFIEASPFLIDDSEDWHITVARSSWGFARKWASENGDQLLRRPHSHPEGPVSVFGRDGRLPYPGIAGVHIVARTSDNYILAALRHPGAAFDPLAWSLSIEESVALDRRKSGGPDEGDLTIHDTVLAGLKEELHIPREVVGLTSCLSVGRHFHRGAAGLDLSGTIICGVQLKIDLETAWRRLQEGEEDAQDRPEHIAWAGIRFRGAADMLALLETPRAVTHEEGTDLLRVFALQAGCDVRFFPYGPSENLADLGLHLTSPVRLHLGLRWFESIDSRR
jgi:hypothetical protein